MTLPTWQRSSSGWPCTKSFRIKIPRLSRHCSRDSEFDMDSPGDRFYTTGPNLFPQESPVCSDRVYTCQTPLRGLSPSRTSQHLNVCLTASWLRVFTSA